MPGGTQDTAVARIETLLIALHDTSLIALGDKGYHGYNQTGDAPLTRYKSRNKPEPQKDANRAPARLRGPSERINAPLKPWHILHKLRRNPHRAGRLAKTSHTLHNHKSTTE